jgi:protein tyrosine phosphatase (PTP) superfamily phosphohydrolase (DUF442 family)
MVLFINLREFYKKGKRAWFQGWSAWRRSWQANIDSPLSRFFAWFDMTMVDHGWFRYLFANRYRVSNKLERANHPTPYGVRRAARRGIKTIVNLRGESEIGSLLLSREACERAGIKLVTVRARSRGLPTAGEILDVKKMFDEIEYPAMMHCKSGADRAGFMSALYLVLHEGRPVSEAKKQLHWRFGHIRHSATGILDHFFDSYERANAQHPIDFLEWVQTRYDPVAMKKEFKASGWANLLVNRILRRE